MYLYIRKNTYLDTTKYVKCTKEKADTVKANGSDE
jgi:hypothetical protein